MIEQFNNLTFVEEKVKLIILEFKTKSTDLKYEKNISKTFDEIWNYFSTNKLLDTPEWALFGETLIESYNKK